LRRVSCCCLRSVSLCGACSACLFGVLCLSLSVGPHSSSLVSFCRPALSLSVARTVSFCATANWSSRSESTCSTNKKKNGGVCVCVCVRDSRSLRLPLPSSVFPTRALYAACCGCRCVLSSSHLLHASSPAVSDGKPPFSLSLYVCLFVCDSHLSVRAEWTGP